MSTGRPGHTTREGMDVSKGSMRLRALGALVGIAAVAVDGDRRRPARRQSRAANPYNLNKAGTLTVGMTLQFKPQMYLDAKGKPAGYDVVLLKALAKQMGVKLDIKNLDFNGLIPGLVAKKFDMVSVGLSATPERRKAVSFSRPYVPYAQILAAPKSDTTPATIAAWNTSDKTITSLQGSTAEQLVQKTFPNATSKSFPDQNAAFLEVATGRANGIVVENYLLAQFNKSNGNKLKEVAVPEAAARRVRLVRRAEGQRRPRGVPEQVHLQRCRRAGCSRRSTRRPSARRCRRCRACK